MAAVRRCINKHIFRLRCDAAVDSRFQIFIFLFIFVKGKVVEEKDELLAADVAEFFHEMLQAFQLAALYLDQAQALSVVAADQGLDGRRLARAAGARQEDVVRFPVGEEGRRIGQELFFLCRVADEVVPFEMREVFDADEAAVVANAEGHELSQLAAAVNCIMMQEDFRRFFRRRSAHEGRFQSLDVAVDLGDCRFVVVQEIDIEEVRRRLLQVRPEQGHIQEQGFGHARAGLA